MSGKEEVKLCPDCERPLHPNPAMNAISRKDNKTRICSDCGKKEGLRG